MVDVDRMPVQTVITQDTQARAFKKYEPGDEPYDARESLTQKLWSVVNAEIGPNAADVLTTKLHQAVIDHISIK